MDWKTIPIHFGQGIDTKSDRKLVVAGKMLRLQNAVFTSAQQVNKRNGYTVLTDAILGGGTITSPRLMKSFKDEIVTADFTSGKLYSYSPTQEVWVDKGNYRPVELTNEVVSRYGTISHAGTTGAALGNIAVFAWVTRNVATGVLSPQASVVDLASGVILISDYFLPGAATTAFQPKCVLIGGTTLGVVYAGVLTQRPLLATLDLSAGTASFNTPVQINTDSMLLSSLSAVGTASGAAITYKTSTQVQTVTFNASGVVQATATETLGSGANTLTQVILEPSTNRLWVYWTDDLEIYYAVYSSALAVVLAATLATTSTSLSVAAMTAVPTASGTQKLLYSGRAASYLSDQLYTTQQVDVTSVGGIGSITVFAQNALVYSQYFTIDGENYSLFLYPSEVQGTFFALKTSDGSLLAKALPGAADSTTFPITQVIQVDASTVILPVGATYTLTNSGGVSLPLTGSNYLRLSSDSTETYQALEANSNLVMNGGQIFTYDGKAVTELGFHLAPSIAVATPSISGGSMAAGDYQYTAIYRSVDEQGNIYESASAIPVEVTIASGVTGSVALEISSLGMTSKTGDSGFVQIFVYRTEANGVVSKLVARINNNTANATVSVTDTTADSSIVGATPIYTTGGVIENIAPPAAMAMVLHNNRLWLISSEDPLELWYCKTFTPTAGINFSDLLTVDVDAVGGNGVALAKLDDKLLFLAERAPIAIFGDGANDVGLNSTLSAPQLVPSDTGCSQSKGVISFPNGVLFKSPKGIYLVDRSLSVKYWGLEVEAYNDQQITASTLLHDKNQIRFLTDDGLTLVYDYVFNQWGTFTNHEGHSADIWQGRYVYARPSGEIYIESPGTYLDDTASFAVLAQTAWLALGEVQGFQRVRRFEMLGDFENGASASHGIQVSAAYDFSDTFSTPVPYLFGAAAAAAAYQYRERLGRQKCDAITLLIEEIVTGDAAESVVLSDMSFEAGVKRGLNKLPLTRSVG